MNKSHEKVDYKKGEDIEQEEMFSKCMTFLSGLSYLIQKIRETMPETKKVYILNYWIPLFILDLLDQEKFKEREITRDIKFS